MNRTIARFVVQAMGAAAAGTVANRRAKVQDVGSDGITCLYRGFAIKVPVTDWDVSVGQWVTLGWSGGNFEIAGPSAYVT